MSRLKPLRDGNMGIRTLPWPACSPDLNPIEHVGDILGRRMQHRACENLNQFFGALREEWDSIPQEDWQVGAVIEKCGSTQGIDDAKQVVLFRKQRDSTHKEN